MPSFRIKKKNLIYPAVVIAVVLSLASFIPALRAPVLNIARAPLELLLFTGRQAEALIFFWRNSLQNERFRKEIDALKQKVSSLQEAEIENKRLKDLLLFKQKSPYKVIAARVIARPAENWSGVVIIDKGRYNGISKGMVAINYLGLIGRVIEASSYNSRVMLMTNPNFAVSAIAKRSRQEGLVSGALGDSLIMRYLPPDADIKVSDTVITSGLTTLYPKGLLIGTVTDVGQEFGGLSRYALVKPAVSLAMLEELFIIVQQ